MLSSETSSQADNTQTPGRSEGWQRRKTLLEVDRKTDILALTSFLLSLIAILTQTYGHIRGPQVELYPPAIVTLTSYNYGTKESPVLYLVVEASMTYTNKGQMGYNDVIRRETVSFIGPDKNEVLLSWHTFFDFSDTAPDDPDKLTYSNTRSAGPEVVAAGSAVSHETRFVPHNPDCRDPESNACKQDNYVALNDALIMHLKQQPRFEFRFSAELFGNDRPRVARCEILTNQIPVEDFKRRNWVALDCYPL